MSVGHELDDFGTTSLVVFLIAILEVDDANMSNRWPASSLPF